MRYLFLLLLIALPCHAQAAASVILKTNHGAIEIALFGDKAPKLVSHFLSLVNKKFYNGLTFHRIVPDSLVQGGDPKGNGSGGPGYCVSDEFSDLRHSEEGIVSFSNEGRDSIGSQFTITLAPVPRLDNRQSIFGKVVRGINVVKKIGSQPLKGSKPKEKIVILSATSTGFFETVPFNPRTELNNASATKTVTPIAKELLQSIAKVQKLGSLSSVKLKTVRSRCEEAQIYFNLEFSKYRKASLLLYGSSQDNRFEIDQFQFSRGQKKG